jgi:uncharacterized membrane protein HdeD (DUF308 family)
VWENFPGHWWVTLVLGIAEMLVAFWAAGYFAGKAVLMVAWIAGFALARGFMETLTAFRLRAVKRELAPS